MSIADNKAYGTTFTSWSWASNRDSFAPKLDRLSKIEGGFGEGYPEYKLNEEVIDWLVEHNAEFWFDDRHGTTISFKDPEIGLLFKLTYL